MRQLDNRQCRRGRSRPGPAPAPGPLSEGLGQAVAHLTVQAQALGLHARQFRAFDRAGLAGEFAVPDHWEAATMAAVGRPAAAGAAPSAPEAFPAARRADLPSRQRRRIDDILWPVA